jgi:hypothetical protein
MVNSTNFPQISNNVRTFFVIVCKGHESITMQSLFEGYTGNVLYAERDRRWWLARHRGEISGPCLWQTTATMQYRDAMCVTLCHLKRYCTSTVLPLACESNKPWPLGRGVRHAAPMKLCSGSGKSNRAEFQRMFFGQRRKYLYEYMRPSTTGM